MVCCRDAVRFWGHTADCREIHTRRASAAVEPAAIDGPAETVCGVAAPANAEPSLPRGGAGVPAIEALEAFTAKPEPFTAKGERAARSSSLGRVQRWGLIALGALALLVTLHRNDVLAKLARSIGGESGYKSLQTRSAAPARRPRRGYARSSPPCRRWLRRSR